METLIFDFKISESDKAGYYFKLSFSNKTKYLLKKYCKYKTFSFVYKTEKLALLDAEQIKKELIRKSMFS